MRFALFKGQSQYGSVRLHVDQLAAALRELDHEARIIDLVAPDAQAQIDAVRRDPPECAFGFSGVGSDWKIDGDSAFDRMGVTYASLYVDHPVHHIGRLSTPIRKNLGFFLDRTHVQFMTAWPKGRGFVHLGFLPPGANELPDPVDLSDAAFAKRDIPVLFTGTYRGEPQAVWRAWEESPARSLAEEVASRMTADARLPILDALRSVLKDLSADLTPDLLDNITPLLSGVQLFAEAYHRDALLGVLGAAGAPLLIYGNGWEPLVARHPSFTYGGVGSFGETLHLLRRARVVLNINNGFVAGGHERVFTAMCGGAAVFSDTSKYYADVFKEGREIATFTWPRMADAPALLMGHLADEGKLAAMARAGALRAQAEHRWIHRAPRLLKAVKQAA
ncbi:MAG: glycosyltransferase [Phenylobacterium sp.]